MLHAGFVPKSCDLNPKRLEYTSQLDKLELITMLEKTTASFISQCTYQDVPKTQTLNGYWALGV